MVAPIATVNTVNTAVDRAVNTVVNTVAAIG
jgi:hypothetical protein